jgi:adenosylmethionine-8-amino-7-oxononanoate aminotransferase
VLASDRLMEPFTRATTTFMHGSTDSGHPVSCAVALANLDIMEREDLYRYVLSNESAFRSTLDKLIDLPIVGDVRGAGFFYGIELVKDKATKQTFTAEESERVLHDDLSNALFEGGLYCRADDRGEPVVQLSPPLICGQQHFDEMEQILRATLTEAWTRSDRIVSLHTILPTRQDSLARYAPVAQDRGVIGGAPGRRLVPPRIQCQSRPNCE